MNVLISVLLTTIAVANAGVLHGHTAALLHGGAETLEGPSSRTTVIGPEGSVITSVAPGGRIVTEEHVGGIGLGHTEAIVASPPVIAHSPARLIAHSPYFGHPAPIVAHSSPLVAHSAPLIGHSNSVIPHAASYVTHSQPIVSAGLVGHSNLVQPVDAETILTGPSGIVSRAGVIHGLPHASQYAVTHHGVIPTDYFGNIVFSGSSGTITTNGGVISGLVPAIEDHHATHELAYDDF